MKYGFILLGPILGLFAIPAGHGGELASAVSTAKDMFSIVVPVAGLLLFYERRLAKLEQKVDTTHEDLKKLTDSITRML